MLRNDVLPIVDFQNAFIQAKKSLSDNLQEYLSFNDNNVFISRFPVLQYPTKVVSFNPEKSPNIKGVLTGIKGQYLIFDAKNVINIRKYEGYEVEIT